MSTSTDVIDPIESRNAMVLGGGIAGLVAGVAFGLLIQFQLGRMTAIGAMYTLGEPSLSLGWVAHLIHSALFGALFGVVVDREPLREKIGAYHVGAGTAVAFGVALWALNIVFLWPVWLNNVGVGQGLPIPNIAIMPLVGHVVYGLLLGIGLAILVRTRALH
ncbi:hypothetical protein [Haloarchaeobius sp. TZWSO28]|uniref:hypothetical protein n=1 Tax=Haloarchaeobius sp. TZWSO28 TaxID=3446119 RepID=UPI003EBE5E32